MYVIILHRSLLCCHCSDVAAAHVTDRHPGQGEHSAGTGQGGPLKGGQRQGGEQQQQRVTAEAE
jgi:hypothetical protein